MRITTDFRKGWRRNTPAASNRAEVGLLRLGLGLSVTKRHLSGSDLRLCLPEAVGQAICMGDPERVCERSHLQDTLRSLKTFQEQTKCTFVSRMARAGFFAFLTRTLDTPSNAQARYAYHASGVLKINREILEKKPSQELLKLIHIVSQWVRLSPELIVCTYHSVSYARRTQ
jgi:hypothetical protein